MAILIEAQVFHGTAVIQDIAFALFIGILVGTYSSIYIASELVVDTMVRRGKLDPNAEGDFKEHVLEARDRKRSGVPAQAKA